MPEKLNNKIKTEWNLSLLYKSPDDPKIEETILSAEKEYEFFVKKYKNTDSWMKNDVYLKSALEDYEKLSDLPLSNTSYYLGLMMEKNSDDHNVRAKLNLLSQRLQKLGNTVLFFDINLSKIPKNFQDKFLKSKELFKFQYFLKVVFQNSRFILTEPEEKILSLKSLPSKALWIDAMEKIRNKQTVKHGSKEIPISEADVLLRELPKQKDRIELHKKVMEKNYEIGDVAESELNAIVINKKIEDELRGYKEPYEATILGYENDKKSVLSLVKSVTDSFHLSQKFYNLKAKMLKLKKLSYADRAVPVGENKKKINFDQSSEILLRLFTSIDPQFGETLNRFLQNGQIDAYPKVGKTGGAFCAHNHNAPTFVLLNHTGSFDSLSTFAHEMGHAIHSEFSKSQPVFYEAYSMSTAEVASTLFEAFLFYDQFEKLSDKEKVIALHDKIQDDVGTIFRQIACFNFEVDMHSSIREKGNLSKEELAKMMNKHMSAYMGKIFNFTEKDGYFFVGWPHLRRFFYVYSYAFGQLASKALYEKYKKDKSYIKELKKFLSLGGSMSPEDIFASIGIDVRKPQFWKEGIKSIEKDIKLLETLIKKK